MVRRTSIVLSLVVLLATLSMVPARSSSFTTHTSPDFTIALEPPTLDVYGHSISNVTIKLTSIGGFSGSIGFNLPGPNCSICLVPRLIYLADNQPLSLPADQSITTTLIVDTSPVVGPPIGECCYKFNITARSYPSFGPSISPVSHTALLTVNIMPGVSPFTILPTNTSMSVGAGSSDKMNVTITTGGYYDVFTGNLTLVRAFGIPDNSSDLTVTFSPNPVYLSAQNLTATTEMTITAAQSTLPGNYTIWLRGVDGVTSYCGTQCTSIRVTVTLNGPYYTISQTSSQIILQNGLPQSANITVTSVNGFAGTVAGNIVLTSPSGVYFPYSYISSQGLSPASISLGPGDSKSIEAFFQSGSGCQQARPEQYTFTATNGTFNRNLQFDVSSTLYPDFIITSPRPHGVLSDPLAALYVQPGTNSTGNVSIASCNGFTGPVSLGVRLDPRYVGRTFVNDTSIVLNPTTVNVGTGTAVNSTVNITVPKDAFSSGGFVNFTGTSQGLLHYSTTIVTIAGEFNLTSTTSSLSLTQGSTMTVPLTLNANFARSFNFTINRPIGLTTSTSTNNVTISRDARSASLSLTISASSTTSPGPYNITVTTSGPRGVIDGNYGKVYRSATISVLVTPTSAGGSSLSPLQIAGVSAALIIGLGSTVLIIRKSRRPKAAQPTPSTIPSSGSS